MQMHGIRIAQKTRRRRPIPLTGGLGESSLAREAVEAAWTGLTPTFAAQRSVFAQGQAPETPNPPSDGRPPRGYRQRPTGLAIHQAGRLDVPQFAICRTKKIKNWTTLGKSVGHNMRTSADERPHLSDAPEPLRVLAGDAGWLAPWREQVNGMHLPKLKQGTAHTLAREFFLGMSPQWAEGKGPAEIDAWAEANIAWLNDRFGKNRVRLAVLHLDEQTPHIAAYVVPLKADANRAGVVHTDRGNGWTLSDSSLGLGGSKDALVKLQDEYGEAMGRFALHRGRRHSKATHQTIAAWRHQMSEPMPAVSITNPPPATVADRIDIEAYGRRVAKAAAREVFKQFKPMRDQAREVPKLRAQIEGLFEELAQLRESVAALKGQRDFFAKALALILGFDPDLSTQHGMRKTVKAVKEARDQLRGKEPAPAAEPAPEAPTIEAAKRAACAARSPNRKPRAPRPGHGPIQ